MGVSRVPLKFENSNDGETSSSAPLFGAREKRHSYTDPGLDSNRDARRLK